ncbi:hypothetical protein CAOG_01089 [Capsaspora owczarzaki ATCC 30864]|uniref:Uncharacterized protein n=1 Tax=Capsaspora owczarzaki (strain ATCC 30864) TaxID=595528 RepID=A0A0D2VI89_CAPO3|nr:hypothetical protein CAOG_01089 [Capsaspora owczarzaki ATCC 30864]KJE89652.1 hypothetical protein CAOG_001089 [Capsaspora owczarzaki ATCC 30864]|eukprot:XP_004365960.1 hypothetical protein CAOG_01089 [Capsaspora owczarzaki ATCC 30864]
MDSDSDAPPRELHSAYALYSFHANRIKVVPSPGAATATATAAAAAATATANSDDDQPAPDSDLSLAQPHHLLHTQQAQQPQQTQQPQQQQSAVGEFLTRESLVNSDFTLTLIAANLSIEAEQELKTFIAKRLLKGSIYAGSGNVAQVDPAVARTMLTLALQHEQPPSPSGNGHRQGHSQGHGHGSDILAGDHASPAPSNGAMDYQLLHPDGQPAKHNAMHTGDVRRPSFSVAPPDASKLSLPVLTYYTLLRGSRELSALSLQFPTDGGDASSRSVATPDVDDDPLNQSGSYRSDEYLLCLVHVLSPKAADALASDAVSPFDLFRSDLDRFSHSLSLLLPARLPDPATAMRQLGRDWTAAGAGTPRPRGQSFQAALPSSYQSGLQSDSAPPSSHGDAPTSLAHQLSSFGPLDMIAATAQSPVLSAWLASAVPDVLARLDEWVDLCLQYFPRTVRTLPANVLDHVLFACLCGTNVEVTVESSAELRSSLAAAVADLAKFAGAVGFAQLNALLDHSSHNPVSSSVPTPADAPQLPAELTSSLSCVVAPNLIVRVGTTNSQGLVLGPHGPVPMPVTPSNPSNLRAKALKLRVAEQTEPDMLPPHIPTPTVAVKMEDGQPDPLFADLPESCREFATELRLALFSAPDPLVLRHALDLYKLRVTQEMNHFKRLVRQAEVDHYALYRASEFLERCGLGAILLRAVSSFDVLSSEEADVLKALTWFQSRQQPLV